MNNVNVHVKDANNDTTLLSQNDASRESRRSLSYYVSSPRRSGKMSDDPSELANIDASCCCCWA
jgi:hypothetical protein